jgi:hypothetical protein
MAEDVKRSHRQFSVTFFFPELKGGAVWQTVKVEGGNMGTALNRAFAEARKRPGVSKRHVSQAKITIAELTHTTAAE